MQEEYLLSKMLKGKSVKERETEIMQSIIETKEKLKIARSNFEYAEDDMIDYYIYQIKANQSKLDYLIKVAKQKGIVLSRDNEIKLRLFSNFYLPITLGISTYYELEEQKIKAEEAIESNYEKAGNNIPSLCCGQFCERTNLSQKTLSIEGLFRDP